MIYRVYRTHQIMNNGDKNNKNIDPNESDENLLDYDETSRPLKKVKILERIDKNWSKEDLQKLLKGIQEFGARLV